MRYRTLATESQFQPEPTKGSRFLACVAPASDEAAALAFIARVAHTHADGEHHCWAWRLAPDQTRSWDAAEPRGSAGRPILAQIEGHDLHFTVAVVVRWFGGTKLGVGGLMRAYGGAAGMALDRADVVARVTATTLSFTHSYDDTHAVLGALAGLPTTILDTRYDTDVTVTLTIDADQAEALIAALRDRTGGRVIAQQAD